MSEIFFLQAGDTLLFKLATPIPETAKLLKGESILHRGDTGNHHKLHGTGFGIFQDGETKYVDVVEGTPYRHEEHAEIMIPPGKYELKFVRERDHFQDLERRVVD